MSVADRLTLLALVAIFFFAVIGWWHFCDVVGDVLSRWIDRRKKQGQERRVVK